MRYIMSVLLCLLMCQSCLAVSVEEGMSFFNSFVAASGSYDKNLLNFYDDNAFIKRIVINNKKSNEVKIISASDYKNKLKYYGKMAEVTKYKNKYTNLQYIQIGNDIKIKGYRKPSTSNELFAFEFLVGKNKKGKMVIKEDITHTKAAFLL